MAGVVDEIKERISIVDVVGQRVPLKKSGRSLKALCPFHNEKTPSFYVFPESGTFKCFGCGAGGDIFTFVMRSENMEFGEALRLLAERAGVNLRPAPEVMAEDQERAHQREIVSAAAAYYHNLFVRATAAQHARDYMLKRGVTQASIESWQIGYALESWDALQTYMLSRGFNLTDLQATGLIIERETGGYYDRFRNRIMFPIYDARANITGFGARALGDDTPKYMNSPQSILFDKSATLYGIEHARESIRQSGVAIIVEGYMDVLIPHQLGITNMVASLGTAVTPRQMEQVKRLCKTLVLALDADAAGDEATLRGLEVARTALEREEVPVPLGTDRWRGLMRMEEVLGTNLRVLALPRGKDPDEVALEDPDGFRRLAADAVPIVEFYFDTVVGRLDLRNPRDKVVAVDRLLPIIGDMQQEVVTQHYLNRLAELVQVDIKDLQAKLRASRPHVTRSTARDKITPSGQPARQQVALDDYCLSVLLYEPALFWRIQDLAPDLADFPGTENRQVFAAFQTFMQANSAFDLPAFRQTLDQTLLQHLDELLRMGTEQPLSSGEELENSLIVTILRGRKQRLNSEITQMTYLLREAKREDDQVEIVNLTNRVHALSEELGRIGRQLNDRSILWRTRGET